MSFNDATISFHSNMTAACSQFAIDDKQAALMDVSGPSRYRYLKLNAEETQAVNALAKKVGIEHESGPRRNTFMVYRVTFLPGQVKVAEDSRDANSEEKEVFRQIFEITASSIARQMGWTVNSDDVTKIVLQKTVDFSLSETQQACWPSIELSQSAADRLGIDKDSQFREYGAGSDDNAINVAIYPGQRM